LLERICLFGSWEQLDLGSQFHTLDYSTNVPGMPILILILLACCNTPFLAKEGGFLHPLKAGGFCR
jgi:hypothetical protein